MDKNCEIVRDLLPLYVDGAASAASSLFVEEHIAGCDECREMLSDLSDVCVENELENEKRKAIGSLNRKIRKKSTVAGCIMAGILMIPIVICLIVNLAVGHSLDWFFIVLASLCVFASLTVVPLTVSENKLLRTLASFTISLTALLGITCLYTKGSWFFVAASSTLFGLSLFFLPFAAKSEAFENVLKNHKGLFVMACDTFLYILMMVSIGFLVKDAEYAPLAFGISLPFAVFAWGLFILIRYTRPAAVKVGSAIALSGAFAFFAPSIIGFLIGSPLPLPRLNGFSSFDANVKWAVLLVSLTVGAVLIAVGIFKRKKDIKK